MMTGIGLINAVLHVVIRLPSFIATLAMSNVILAVSNYITRGTNLYKLQNWPKSFTVLGQGLSFGFLPNPIIALIIVAMIMWFYTEHTKWGKSLYLVGSNAKACDYLGVSARKQKILGFVLCSVLCGFAGVIRTSTVNMAAATLCSNGMTDAITVMMLGAMVFKHGVYNIPGVLVGSALVAVLDNGLVMTGADLATRNFVSGATLIVSIAAVNIVRYGLFRRRPAF